MIDLYVRMVLMGQKNIEEIKPLWREAVRIKVYIKQIQLDQMTLNDIPIEWRETVQEELNKL